MTSPQRLPVHPGLRYLSDSALAHYERTATALRTREISRTPTLVDGDFDFPHLQRIHQYVLQDVYPWAGELRTQQTLAFGIPHVPVDQLAGTLPDVFNDIGTIVPDPSDARQAAEVLAHHWSNLTMVHPFVDGNSRTQRIFFTLYLQSTTDLEIDWQWIDPDAMHAARHMAFLADGDMSWLAAQLEPGIVSYGEAGAVSLATLADTAGIKDDQRSVEIFTSMVEHHIDGGDGHSFAIPDLEPEPDHPHQKQLDHLDQLDRDRDHAQRQQHREHPPEPPTLGHEPPRPRL